MGCRRYFSPDQDPTLAEVGDMEVTANQFISSYQRIISELNLVQMETLLKKWRKLRTSKSNFKSTYK